MDFKPFIYSLKVNHNVRTMEKFWKTKISNVQEQTEILYNRKLHDTMKLITKAIEQANKIKLAQIQANFLMGTNLKGETEVWLLSCEDLLIHNTKLQAPKLIIDKNLRLLTRRTSKGQSEPSKLFKEGNEIFKESFKLSKARKLLRSNNIAELRNKIKDYHYRIGLENNSRQKKLNRLRQGKKVLNFKTYTMFCELTDSSLLWRKRISKRKVVYSRIAERKPVCVADYRSIFCHGKAVEGKYLSRLENLHKFIENIYKPNSQLFQQANISFRQNNNRPSTTKEAFKIRQLNLTNDETKKYDDTISNPVFSVMIRKMKRKRRPNTNAVITRLGNFN